MLLACIDQLYHKKSHNQLFYKILNICRCIKNQPICSFESFLTDLWLKMKLPIINDTNLPVSHYIYGHKIFHCTNGGNLYQKITICYLSKV